VLCSGGDHGHQRDGCGSAEDRGTSSAAPHGTLRVQKSPRTLDH
jgi:hypothetical protein